MAQREALSAHRTTDKAVDEVSPASPNGEEVRLWKREVTVSVFAVPFPPAGTNGYLKRHPNKELQLFLFELHLSGWIIENPPKYYKAFCTCRGKHRTTIHLTPSGRYCANHKRQHLYNTTCFMRAGRR